MSTDAFSFTDDDWQRLHTLLRDMEVPPDRVNDLGWLARNLAIRNKLHPNFNEAIAIVRSKLLDLNRSILRQQ